MVLSSNIAAPPSLNLVREVIISIRVLKIRFIFAIIVGVITFLGAAYNLYIYSSQQSNNILIVNQHIKRSSSFYLALIFQVAMPFIIVVAINVCISERSLKRYYLWKIKISVCCCFLILNLVAYL